jgi:predicted nucleic acid-binding protein
VKKVVLDTGVILSFLDGEFREYYNKVLNQEVTAYVSAVNLAELYYVLCRFEEFLRGLETKTHLSLLVSKLQLG